MPYFNYAKFLKCSLKWLWRGGLGWECSGIMGDFHRSRDLTHEWGVFSHGSDVIRSMFTVLVRLVISVLLNLCCVVKNSPSHTSTGVFFSGGGAWAGLITLSTD